MRLARAYPAERLEAACRRALAIGTFSYKSVKSVLSTGLGQAGAGEQRSLSQPTTLASVDRTTTPTPTTERGADDHATLDLLNELRPAGMPQAFEEQPGMPDIGELAFEDPGIPATFRDDQPSWNRAAGLVSVREQYEQDRRLAHSIPMDRLGGHLPGLLTEALRSTVFKSMDWAGAIDGRRDENTGGAARRSRPADPVGR